MSTDNLPQLLNMYKDVEYSGHPCHLCHRVSSPLRLNCDTLDELFVHRRKRIFSPFSIKLKLSIFNVDISRRFIYILYRSVQSLPRSFQKETPLRGAPSVCGSVAEPGTLLSKVLDIYDTGIFCGLLRDVGCSLLFNPKVKNRHSRITVFGDF